VNAVLESILSTRSVTDGVNTLSLAHPDFPQFSVNMDPEEGRFLQDIVEQVRPSTSLEIGFAYGVSTLYICDALARLAGGGAPRHIVMDPFQSTQWRGIGLRNVQQAGFSTLVDFREERSELLLPQLVASGTTVDFALIDGWHTFDQVMVEFFFINRMLRVGGVVAFDDANRRSVNRVIRHALTYSAYQVFSGSRAEAPRPSIAGRLRRAAGRLPYAGEVVRPDFLRKDWDLGILGSCIALQKVAEDQRTSGWDRPF
jgi:predicted O-methyltransferase YrrM